MICLIQLKFSGKYLTYHLLKKRIINIKQVIYISLGRVKCFNIRKRQHQVSLMTKQICNKRSAISTHRNTCYLSIRCFLSFVFVYFEFLGNFMVFNLAKRIESWLFFFHCFPDVL